MYSVWSLKHDTQWIALNALNGLNAKRTLSALTCINAHEEPNTRNAQIKGTSPGEWLTNEYLDIQLIGLVREENKYI